MKHRMRFLAMTSPLNPMTQMRFCPKEIHFWRETRDLTEALHQIKSEVPPVVCHCECVCVPVSQDRYLIWLGRWRGAFADYRASVSVYANASRWRRHGICDRMEDRQIVSQHLVSQQTLCYRALTSQGCCCFPVRERDRYDKDHGPFI